jgi:hypothetical protein
MKSGYYFNLRGLAVCALASLLAASAWGQQAGQQKEGQPNQVQVSEAERKALDKINTAPDPSAKLQAAGEYLKKFGKSQMRPRVASYVSTEIGQVQDPASRLQLMQTFSSTFNQPGEADLVKPLMIDTYIKSSKFDEAFAEGGKYLQAHPDDISVLTQLALVGADQAQRQNPKYIAQSKEYTARAIEMMEGDRRPTTMEAAAWTEYKNQWLPRLYQGRGFVLYVTDERAPAREALEKSAGLNPRDPFTMMLLGTISNDEYQAIAKRYNAEKAGPGKEALLKEAYTKMDEVIDWYARAVAATGDNAQYAALRDQIMNDLKSYYSARHNGSTDGLSQLIEKYKKP